MQLWQRLERPVVLLLGVAGVAAVGLIDFETGAALRVDALFLLPVGFVAWKLGKRTGFVFAALSAAACLASNGLALPNREGALVTAWNTGAQLAALLGVAYLVAELHERLEREPELARTDALTGLPNGNAFRERAALEVERARRWSRPLTLALLDLDAFEALNEEFGRDAGDEMLRTVAVSLRSTLRSTDLAARIGGDEFGLLLPETDKPGAKVVLERTLDRLRQDMSRGGWPVTASAASVTSVDAVDGPSLLRQADRVLYEVRKAGTAVPFTVETAGASPTP